MMDKVQNSASKPINRAILLGGIAGLSLWAPAALAQTTSPVPPTATSPKAETEVVVVTARFRSEALQDVPIAITALGGDALAAKNLNNIQDISRSVPTVDFRDSSSNKDRTIFIRGVGTISTSPGVEASVSVVMDGVVLTRPGQATLDLVDIERIEVLRGPQGTLFGKNASAGVINVVTRRPSEEFSARVTASAFSDGEKRISGTLSGPLGSEKLLYSVSGLYGEFDGNQVNLTTGNDINGYERQGGRAKLQYQPNEDVTLTVNADYIKTVDDVPNGAFVASTRVLFPTNALSLNPTLAAILRDGGIVPSLSNTTVRSSFDSMVEDENYGASVQADVRLGNEFGFTSITAYREWDNLQTQDYDSTDRFTAAGITGSQVGGVDRGQVNSNQFSQELRLTSPSGNFFDYVVGAYFLKARTVENYQRTISRLETGVVRVYPGVADYAVNSTNAAVFGEGTFTISDKFKTFIGGRLIRDNLSFYHRRNSNAPAGLPGITPNIANEGSTSKSDYSARIGVQYDLTPSINLYSTLARGYKGPAYSISFNMAQAATRALEPETSVSFEAGMKGSFFNRALTLNLAAYSTEFDGFQANYSVEFNGAFSTQLTNAGSVKSEGIEGDFTWRPIENLRIGGAFTLSDAHIIRFICPSNTTCPNYDGRTLPFAPKSKANLDISYVIPLGGDMEIELGADYSWKDDTQYQLTQNPDTIQPAYGIWNASVALAAGDKWELRLVGKNLANQEYSSFIANGNVSGVVRYVPRDIESYYGLIAKARF